MTRLTEDQLFLIASLIPNAEQIGERAAEATSADVSDAEALEFGDAVRWALLGIFQEFRGRELSEEEVLAPVERAVDEISG